MKKQTYWFRVTFGKWEEETFDPDVSNVYVEAWDAKHAAHKALTQIENEEGEIVISVEFLGYKQI